MTKNYFYRPDIDGIRAIAVFCVILFHTFPSAIHGGFVGVDIFFVISGYVITKHISIKDFTHISILDFYSRRAKRIFPTLFVVLATTYLIGWVELFSNEFSELAIQMVAASSFTGNLLFWHQSGYFDTAAHLKPLLHTWSLGVEEQFYVVWPMLILLSLKSRISPLRIAIATWIVSFALNILLSVYSPTADFYSPFSRFWEIMTGCILALTNWNLPERLKRNISIFGALLLFFSVFLITSSPHFPGFLALFPTLGCALVIASGSTTKISQALSSRVLVYFGLISYPLYLWHWPILVFAKIASHDQPGIPLRIGTILATIVLAALTYLFIERPIRYNLPNKKSVMIAFMSILITASVGGITYYLNGIPIRAINSRTCKIHFYEFQ